MAELVTSYQNSSEVYTGAWDVGSSVILGGTDLKALRPRKSGDTVWFMALLSRRGMRIPRMRDTGGFGRAYPYSK
jgi:hypothetical protein